MLTATEINNSLVRSVKAKVEFYKGSTLVDTFNYDGALQEIKIERVGEDSKFFGFGVCQKLNVKLRDKDRAISTPAGSLLKVYFDNLQTSPTFIITENHRDEKTNQLSITAYDLIYGAGEKRTGELSIQAPYTIKDYTLACGALVGAKSVKIIGVKDTCFDTVYPTGANIEGTESIREILTDIAEATQTIFYVDENDNLIFKRLDKDGAPVLTIDKSLYVELISKPNKRLTAVCHATQLGDNVITQGNKQGTTQFVRDNAFWELREDIDIIVENALANVLDMTINQFDCSWRGDYRVEIGDKIGLTTKDNKTVFAYLLNDTIAYNGAFSQKTKWQFTDNSEDASNPSTLGDALNQTFAKVDKVNKQIDIVVKDTQTNKQAISAIQLNNEEITTKVSAVEQKTQQSIDGMNSDLAVVKNEVESKVSKDGIRIAINEELNKGIDNVKTTTGFTFNQDGLKVSKSGQEMETLITEDGMKVLRDNQEVLTANNIGVDAKNLHATTYLIIGRNSRFEDYGYGRTGCFWIS